MHHLAAAWFMGESLLAWLNPSYVPRFETNRVYARMALRRTLVSEADRRVVMLVNRRAIDLCPSLKALCSVGLSADKLQELMIKRARTASSGVPKSLPEKEAYVLQKVMALAEDHFDVPDVILPGALMSLSERDSVVRGFIRSVQKNACSILSKLSTEYGVIAFVGRDTARQSPASPPCWFPVAPRDEIVPVLGLGRSGGHPRCPSVRLVPSDNPGRVAASEALSAIWQM